MQIIKTFAISKLVFSDSTQCVPDYIVKRIKRILVKFLWQSKDNVKLVRMIQHVESRGLNDGHEGILQFLSATWIIRNLEANYDEDNWVQLPRFVTSC